MSGRVKRRRALQEAEAQCTRPLQPEELLCALCGRPLGLRVEWHHAVPKSEGGTVTVPLHPICHRAIHAHVSNHDLAHTFADLDVLRARKDIHRFLLWIANKPSDFHAPTRQQRL